MYAAIWLFGKNLLHLLFAHNALERVFALRQPKGGPTLTGR